MKKDTEKKAVKEQNKKTSSSSNKTEIKEKTIVAKKEKEVKLKAVSLPSLFKKKYTEKKLNKKIYKKIYIPEDLKFLKSLVQQVALTKKNIPLYSIPRDIKLSKKDANRLNLLAKSIKKQKGRVKWGSLIALLAFFVIIIGGITLTKNLIAKTIIVNTCESIFKAKCDIGYLNISFFDTSFKVKNLEIADKDQPMKNLISIESIVLDFDLLQLLRSRFVAEELSLEKVESNTDRKYSGDISEKLKAKMEKKQAKKAKKEAKKNEESAFMKSLKSKSDAALSSVTNSITEVFQKYNPENVLDNCFEQMKTPAFSQKIQAEVPSLYTKYKEIPDFFQGKVNTITTSTNELTSIDFSNIAPEEIPEILKKIEQLSKDIESIKKDSEKTISDVKNDYQYVISLKEELENAIANDKNLISDAISTYTSISLDDGKEFISGTFDNICYQFLGKYYPYVRDIVLSLANSKNNNKDKKENKISDEKSTPVNRMKGRNVFYKYDSCPKFWIKKISGSGSNFAFNAINITNDMDKTNQPASANINFLLKDVGHTANLSVDTRSTSSEPLIFAEYKCSNLPLSYPSSKISTAPGVPGLDSSLSNLDFIIKIFENEAFNISGSGEFSNMVLSANPFEPANISQIYLNTLKSITSMNLLIDAKFSKDDGVNLNLDTNADDKFMTAITNELKAQAAILADEATVKMTAKINEVTNNALGEVNNFAELTDKITNYDKIFDDLQNKLKEKTNQAQNVLENKINSTKKAAEDAVNAKIKEAEDNTKAKIKDSTKNLLNNLKKN